MSTLQRISIEGRDCYVAGAGAATATVVMLHGAGATAEWMADETGWLALAERENFTTVFPEGTRTHRDKPPKFLTNPQRWNDDSPPAREWADAPDDVALIDAIVRHFTPGPVFLTGFSNGAGMTFRAAAELPGRFAAIAPVAGHFWDFGSSPIVPVPTLYIIGKVDPLIPLRGGEVVSPWKRTGPKPSVRDSLDRWAARCGCAVPPTVEAIDGVGKRWTYSGLVVAEVIDGLGHHWPGGLGRLPERFGGPSLSRVNATERIWEFFRDVVTFQL